ncbi:MAG: STAS/SEC14 domain-containing protein [Cyclobacteriaceae bacterium]
MSITLFESEHLTIRYDQQKDYLLLKWNGFSKGQEFRDFANEVLKAIAHTKTKRILSDNTNWTTIAPNDQGWAANNWFPKVEASGVRKLATVLSKDFFHRTAERSIEGMTDVDCIHIKNFESTEEASAWLNQNAPYPQC